MRLKEYQFFCSPCILKNHSSKIGISMCTLCEREYDEDGNNLNADEYIQISPLFPPMEM